VILLDREPFSNLAVDLKSRRAAGAMQIWHREECLWQCLMKLVFLEPSRNRSAVRRDATHCCTCTPHFQCIKRRLPKTNIGRFIFQTHSLPLHRNTSIPQLQEETLHIKMFESATASMPSSLLSPTSITTSSNPRRPSLSAFKYPTAAETTTHTGKSEA
jgi:hypothetical protein